MLKSFSIENFKCFSQRRTFSFGKITVCAGMNSVGKSSLIQSLLLVRQIYDNTLLYQNTNIKELTIQLNGIYGLELGQAERIKSSSERDNILLTADNFEFRLSSKDQYPRQLFVPLKYSLVAFNQITGLFAPDFYYLNAERLGPRNYQQILPETTAGCGIHGENTFHFISQHLLEKIEEERQFPFSEDKITATLNKQLEYWMDYIIPGIELNISELSELGLSNLSIRQPVFDTDFTTPYNFGFGISYVLPIIANGLLSKKGSMLIVENPEAHLHPCGQSRIGFFLAYIASAGIQVVVETHSEHVINGIRIAGLKSQLAPEDICINFFSADYKNSQQKVQQIPLDEKMDILEWPEGFLDQEENDLRTLRILRREK